MTSPGVVTLIVTIEVFKRPWILKTEENLGQGALLVERNVDSRPGALRPFAFSSVMLQECIFLC